MTELDLLDLLLVNRGIDLSQRASFLNPSYSELDDPFELADMKVAVDRLKSAYDKDENILIYGDYDSDGITSTALLLDALKSLGFNNVEYRLPNRFYEGYGLNKTVIEHLLPKPDVIVTVDCGSMNHVEIESANKLGIDVIVTDHHSVSDDLPEAIAVVNPNRPDSKYKNRSLSGVGVAFNLAVALQRELNTLPLGQEKWLLDLVAIGTIADLVPLNSENRILAKYGLMVLSKTRRLGLKYLMSTAGFAVNDIKSDTVAFGIAPRFNAAGRLESAELALDILLAETESEAKSSVERLEYLNQKRKALQNKIIDEATKQAELSDDAVLVLTGKNWHEGVVGIVASKIMETFSRPAFVLHDDGEFLKGSARSFGEFSIAEAIHANADLLESGGGHAAAGGVKLKKENLDEFTKQINKLYKSKKLKDQLRFLEAKVDIDLPDLSLLNKKFYDLMSQMEPFGVGNPEPIFLVHNLRIERLQKLGREANHYKLRVSDESGNKMDVLGFGLVDKYPDLALGCVIELTLTLMLNQWQGKNSVEGRIISLAFTK